MQNPCEPEPVFSPYTSVSNSGNFNADQNCMYSVNAKQIEYEVG